MTDPDRWIVASPSRLTPLVDLLCLPGAGAGASAFSGWASRLPAFAALLCCQLPGREDRIDEPPAGTLGQAAEAIAAAYLARRPAPRPLVLFGHSMGAVLAFEVARLLDRAARPAGALVISASTPPKGVAQPLEGETLRQLLLDYDPANREILSDPELFETLAPVLGRDIAMLRAHAIAPEGATTDTPALLLAGAADPVVPPAAVEAWRRHLAGPIESRTIPGGHHAALRESRESVIALLAAQLAALARMPAVQAWRQ